MQFSFAAIAAVVHFIALLFIGSMSSTELTFLPTINGDTTNAANSLIRRFIPPSSSFMLSEPTIVVSDEPNWHSLSLLLDAPPTPPSCAGTNNSPLSWITFMRQLISPVDYLCERACDAATCSSSYGSSPAFGTSASKAEGILNATCLIHCLVSLLIIYQACTHTLQYLASQPHYFARSRCFLFGHAWSALSFVLEGIIIMLPSSFGLESLNPAEMLGLLAAVLATSLFFTVLSVIFVFHPLSTSLHFSELTVDSSFGRTFEDTAALFSNEPIPIQPYFDTVTLRPTDEVSGLSSNAPLLRRSTSGKIESASTTGGHEKTAQDADSSIRRSSIAGATNGTLSTHISSDATRVDCDALLPAFSGEKAVESEVQDPALITTSKQARAYWRQLRERNTRLGITDPRHHLSKEVWDVYWRFVALQKEEKKQGVCILSEPIIGRPSHDANLTDATRPRVSTGPTLLETEEKRPSRRQRTERPVYTWRPTAEEAPRGREDYKVERAVRSASVNARRNKESSEPPNGTVCQARDRRPLFKTEERLPSCRQSTERPVAWRSTAEETPRGREDYKVERAVRSASVNARMGGTASDREPGTTCQVRHRRPLFQTEERLPSRRHSTERPISSRRPTAECAPEERDDKKAIVEATPHRPSTERKAVLETKQRRPSQSHGFQRTELSRRPVVDRELREEEKDRCSPVAVQPSVPSQAETDLTIRHRETTKSLGDAKTVLEIAVETPSRRHRDTYSRRPLETSTPIRRRDSVAHVDGSKTYSKTPSRRRSQSARRVDTQLEDYGSEVPAAPIATKCAVSLATPHSLPRLSKKPTREMPRGNHESERDSNAAADDAAKNIPEGGKLLSGANAFADPNIGVACARRQAFLRSRLKLSEGVETEPVPTSKPLPECTPRQTKFIHESAPGLSRITERTELSTSIATLRCPSLEDPSWLTSLPSLPSPDRSGEEWAEPIDEAEDKRHAELRLKIIRHIGTQMREREEEKERRERSGKPSQGYFF